MAKSKLSRPFKPEAKTIDDVPILQRLIDLHRQATVERSHFYVAHCVRDAIKEIMRLQQKCAAFDKICPPDLETIIAKGIAGMRKKKPTKR